MGIAQNELGIIPIPDIGSALCAMLSGAQTIGDKDAVFITAVIYAYYDLLLDRSKNEHPVGILANAIECCISSSDIPLDLDQRVKTLLAGLAIPSYLTDADGALTYYNVAAARLWGWRPIEGAQYWCGSWKLFGPDQMRIAHKDCSMGQSLRTRNKVRGSWSYAERPDGTRVAFTQFPTPLLRSDRMLRGGLNLLAAMMSATRPGAATA